MAEEEKGVDLSDMAGKGLVWPIGKKIFKLTPLYMDDLAEFEAWVKNQHSEQVSKIANGLMEGKQEFLMNALKNIPAGNELNKLLAKVMVTLEGARKLLHMSISKKHPKVTERDVFQMVTPANLDYVLELADKISGFSLKPEEKKEGKEKKEGEEVKKK